MLGNVWRGWARAVVSGACLAAPFGCAHGVEVAFDPTEGQGGTFTGSGGAAGVPSGSTSVVTGVGAGGASTSGAGGATGEGGSSAGASGSGHAGDMTAGAGGAAGGAGGMGGAGVAGSGGSAPDAGQGGAGTGGSTGASGATGMGGMGGTTGAGGRDSGSSGGGGSSGGASGGKPDAGVDSGPSCPVGLDLSGLFSTPGYGSRFVNDVLYTDTCPSGQVVIGYEGSVDTRTPVSIGRIRTQCGTLSVTSSNGCRVAVTPSSPLPMRGTAGTVTFVQTCPANQIVVGFQGRSSLVLDQVGFLCAPLTISRVGSTWDLAVGATTATPRAGGTGGTAFVELCPTDQIARGTNVTIYTGFVGAFGIICGTPALR